MKEQFLALALRSDEEELDRSLRPRRLDDFVGQPGSKEQLAIVSRRRGRAARHWTTCSSRDRRGSARRVSRTSSARRSESGSGASPARRRTQGRRRDPHQPRTARRLFIDEIHRLTRPPRRCSTRRSRTSGSTSSWVRALPRGRSRSTFPFTLIGATTRTGLLTTPLRDRFGMTSGSTTTTSDDLGLIVRRSARILGLEIEDEAAAEIARRSRGTPRVANRILRRVRDVAEVR